MLDNSDQYFSKTLEKGFVILDLFDRDHPRRRLSEISQLTGINKTSVYRFVSTMVKLGYLSKNNRLLKLGPRALLLGHNFIQSFDLLQGIKPLIDKAFIENKITIDSALLHGLTLLALYRREAPGTVFFRQPLINQDFHARAIGKAVLAQLNENELLHILDRVSLKKHTAKTISRKEDIVPEIEVTKERGYSINNEEFMSGLICIGAPLLNFKTKSVVGAISFDFPSSEQSLSSIERNYTGILTKLASDISEMITLAEN